ncbi:beta-parvin isoform X1 [Alosa pseudoharengus]|uniref:beta-parvin isoform X1 n=1 Tax=Alosa pseudoharengus TaxID=34774 RepID=UPI003F8BB584
MSVIRVPSSLKPTTRVQSGLTSRYNTCRYSSLSTLVLGLVWHPQGCRYPRSSSPSSSLVHIPALPLHPHCNRSTVGGGCERDRNNTRWRFHRCLAPYCPYTHPLPPQPYLHSYTPTPSLHQRRHSFGDMAGFLCGTKRKKQVSDLQEEGKNAIIASMQPSCAELLPEDTLLEENAERSILDPSSRENPKFKDLQKVLIDWVNSELVEDRIIVKDLEEDLYDGQVLQKLFEKLSQRKLNVAEVTQSEIGQKQKLQTVLEAVNDVLRPEGWSVEWGVDSIHSKNLVAIVYLLVTLAMHFQAPIRLPEHVSVQVVVVKKKEGLLHTSHVTKELTTTTEMMMGRFERDAFDTLLDHAPDKLNVVKTSLITFVNKHLNKLNLEVTELESQFADGVYLVLLMGLLEDYFVPLYNFYLTPESFEQKVHNVAFAFELMQDGGLKKPKARPEDVVNLNLKSTLRVLYNLFTNYKNSE